MPRALRGPVLAAVAALLLTGCAGDQGPAPMTLEQFDAFDAAVHPDGSTTVGDAVAAAPAGTVWLRDVRIAAGVDDEEIVVPGTPTGDLLDWIVVGYCGYPEAVPTVEVAAVPPEHAAAVLDGSGVDLVCDGPSTASTD